MAKSSNILRNYNYQDVGVNPNFSKDIILSTQKILVDGINDIAKKRDFEEGITIDFPGTKMQDDGIMVIKTKKGYQVTVSFCDVGSGINVLSSIGLEALNRVQTEVSGKILVPIFPYNLSHSVFSLNENELKPALSVKLDIDFEGHIENIKVFQSKFKNIKKLTFQDFENDLKNPDSKYFEIIKNINEVAKLRFARIKKINLSDVVISRPGDFEIGELMKMTGYAVNRFLVQSKVEQIIKFDKSKYYIGSHFDPQSNSNYTTVTSPLRYYSDFLVGARISKILNDIPFVFSKEDLDFVLNRINNYKQNKNKPNIESKKPKNNHHKKPSKSQNIHPKIDKNQEERISVLKKFADIKNKDFLLEYLPKALISKDKDILKYYDDYIFKLKIFDIQEVISSLNKTLNIGNDFYIKPPFLISQSNLEDQTIINFEFEDNKIFSISTLQTCKKEFYTNQKSKAITGLRVHALKKILEYFMK